MAVPLTYRQRTARKLPRMKKILQQCVRVARSGQRPDTRFVFVVGSQRSGTRLPIQVLDHAPQVMTYSEGAAPFFRDVLLQPLDRVETLRRRSLFPVVALKPICETHRIHELLDRFPGSRAVWIFRHYQDAVQSATRKWSSGREAVRRLASDQPETAGWRLGGLTAEKLALVRDLYREDMSLYEANAVMWYLRNSLFFDLAADERRDILLVQYEDLVERPGEGLSQLFEFLRLKLPTGADDGIRRSGEGTRSSLPDVSPRTLALCQHVHDRLMERVGCATS